MTSTLSPVVVADFACHTGEGPLWHPAEQRLCWTDIPAGRLFRYEPASGSQEQCLSGRLVSALTIQTDGTFLLFGMNGSITHCERTIELVNQIPTEVGTRFNDVEVDPIGRVICGTMPSPTHPGRLYRLNLDRTLDVLLDGVDISNGIGFSADQRTMYYSESNVGLIHAFDYDVGSGSLSNRRIFAQVARQDGLPDGLIVDADDNIWSARWDGWCIVKYSPDGAIIDRLDFPVPKVSSLTFGGPKLTDLYVTTAGGNQKEVDGPLAGALFVVRDAGLGAADYLSRIVLPNV